MEQKNILMDHLILLLTLQQIEKKPIELICIFPALNKLVINDKKKSYLISDKKTILKTSKEIP